MCVRECVFAVEMRSSNRPINGKGIAATSTFSSFHESSTSGELYSAIECNEIRV